MLSRSDAGDTDGSCCTASTATVDIHKINRSPVCARIEPQLVAYLVARHGEYIAFVDANKEKAVNSNHNDGNVGDEVSTPPPAGEVTAGSEDFCSNDHNEIYTFCALVRSQLQNFTSRPS